MKYFSSIKRKEIMSFVATWMDPDLQNVKRNDTSELTYKSERDSQRMNLWFPGGKYEGKG